MLLDLRTIVVGNLLTDVVCILVMMVLWRQSRNRFRGTGHWVVGFSFQMAALFLIVLRNQIPDMISMVVSNTLAVGGAIVVYRGLGRFVGKRTPQVHNYLMLAVFAAVHAYFAVVQPDLAARNLNLSVGILFVTFQCAWLMLRRVDRTMRGFTRSVGAVFVAYSLVSVFRIVDFFIDSHETVDYLQAGLFESLVLLTYQMLLILHTVTLALMVNKRLLAEVRSEEEKFSTAFRSSPYAITLTRLSDGLITDVNDGFVDITGYSRPEAIRQTTVGLHLWDREEDRAEVVAELQRAGKDHGKEFYFRKKSGEVFPGLFSSEILQIDNEAYVLSSINDITERRRIEVERRRFEDAARLQQKQEAIGTLARGAAHEINNPLNIVMNYGQLLLDDPTASEHVKDCAGNIVKESDRIAVIVRNLLGFSSPESLVPRPAQIADIVEQTLSLSRAALGTDGITVQCVIPEGLHAIKCRSQQIQQVLISLLANARDALNQRYPKADADKVIRIEASAFEKNGIRWIRLTVVDHGSGIPPDVAGKVFDPFFSTKTRHKGTGLGLSASLEIVKEHRGEIGFDTEPGKGTRFHVDLPINYEGTERNPAD